MIYNKQETQKLTEKDTGITFKLSRDFLEKYQDKDVPFGFNGAGFLAYMRTYSRVKDNDKKEQWFETCARVVNGVYSIQKRHILKFHLGWDEDKARASAQEMYDRMFKMKWLPPGRGIWAMGSPIIEEKGLFAALNNCGFTATTEDSNFVENPAKPFAFLMDMSMLGVGVGFDTEGAGSLKIMKPNSVDKNNIRLPFRGHVRAGVETNLSLIPTIKKYLQKRGDFKATKDMVEFNEETQEWELTDEMNDLIMNKINWHETGELREGYVYEIPDTREGWVESTSALINSYLLGTEFPIMRYTKIRPKGTSIDTFGGTASGPDPLIYLHQQIIKQFEGREGEELSSRDIVDLFNKIGVCVVSGNVRRSAEIAFGQPDDKDYLKLKDYNYNPDLGEYGGYEGPEKERAAWGWSSNNSIFADVGMDYSEHGAQTAKNGEPGYLWLENAKKHGRMNNLEATYADSRAKGANPCVEQTLEDKELCCLVETFPTRADSLDDYKRTLKFAYLYAKTVTLGNTHWVETNRVMMRNRRIGASMSGIAQFIDSNGLHKLKQFCTEGYSTIQYYDEVYSDWLAVPRSIKTTSVKPSGTVSLLPGVTPGVHFPEDNFYIRRVTLSKDSPLVDACKEAGYKVEDAVDDNSAVKVEIPVAIKGVRTVDEVSMWEQLEIAAFMQEYWADNQVSCTVTFQKYEANQIPHALNYYQYRLKGISFLPKLEEGVYAQAPYESITEEKFNELDKHVKDISFKGEADDAIPEKYCDNDVCEI